MKQKLILGTAILTLSGILCRLIGFFYRIFLARTIGAEGMGIYQLILPVYHLCYAISTAGIQTALSRSVAASIAKKEYNKALYTFFVGTLLSFLISLCLLFFINKNASFYSSNILDDVRCIPLLKLTSYALPFGALHGCIMGWFMGQKQVHIPAGMQVLEELTRLGVTYACYHILLVHDQPPTPSIAVIGLFCGEIVSVLFSFIVILRSKVPHLAAPEKRFYISATKELLVISFPLTINRIALNLLHSVEAVLIPYSLQKFNMSRTVALETLGTVTGMALPLVLFPTAIINALSTILLPTISENQALRRIQHIRSLIKRTSFYALSLGIICSFIFAVSGKWIGSFLYKSTDAGQYIVLLSLICPFLFLDIVLASIMNGLGKTFLCFSVNFFNMCFRITMIYLLVPNIGITGYLAGLILGEILCCILSLFILYRLIFSKDSHFCHTEILDK